MKAPHHDGPSDLGVLWSVLWRAVVCGPLLLAFFVVVGGLWLGRWILLPVVVLCMSTQLWTHAGLFFFVWFAALFLYRWLRLSRLYEDPPSLL